MLISHWRVIRPFLALALSLICLPALATDKVVLQLKWEHEFQFVPVSHDAEHLMIALTQPTYFSCLQTTLADNTNVKPGTYPVAKFNNTR